MDLQRHNDARINTNRITPSKAYASSTPTQGDDWQVDIIPNSVQTAASISPGPTTASSDTMNGSKYRGHDLDELRSRFNAAKNPYPVKNQDLQRDMNIPGNAAVFKPKARTLSSQFNHESSSGSAFQRNSQQMPSKDFSSSSRDIPGLSYGGLRPSMKTSAYDNYTFRDSRLGKQAAIEKCISENRAKRHGNGDEPVPRILVQAPLSPGAGLSAQSIRKEPIKMTNNEQITKSQPPISASSQIACSNGSSISALNEAQAALDKSKENEYESIRRALVDMTPSLQKHAMATNDHKPTPKISPFKTPTTNTSKFQQMGDRFRALAPGIPEGASSLPAMGSIKTIKTPDKQPTARTDQMIDTAEPSIDVSPPRKSAVLNPSPTNGNNKPTTKPTMRRGLADDPSAFLEAAKAGRATFSAKQLGPKKQVEYPDEEEVTFSKGYGAPEPREGPPARPRRILLSGLSSSFKARNVADLVHGGALESIVYTAGNFTATVTFCQPEDAKNFYDVAPNGIASPEGGTVFVELDKQIIPQSSNLKMCIEKSLSRVVRVVGVDKKVTPQDLKEVAKWANGKVEHVSASVLNSGARKVEFRMCSINDALALAQSIRRNPEWEHCNITYAPDPCAVATGSRFSS